MTLKSAKCDLYGIKITIISEKLQKVDQRRVGAAHNPPLVMYFSYTSLLTTSPNLTLFFENILTFGLSPPL